LADLGLSGNVFHRVGATSDKPQAPAFVFTLGMASKFDFMTGAAWVVLLA